MKVTAQDFDTGCRTLYGEARGEDVHGMKLVAHTLLNRADRRMRGKNLHEVCTAKWQFSCWNEGDPNLPKMQAVGYEDHVFGKCVRVLLEAIEDHSMNHDPTQGSTHYHTKAVKPNWADGHTPVVKHGAHLFYNTVK